jgi:PAP2 superfamily
MKKVVMLRFSSMMLLNLLFLATAFLPAFAQTESAQTSNGAGHCGSSLHLSCTPSDSQVEPKAGKWRTWVISSGKDYRVPPPPGHRETRAELRLLADLIRDNDAQARQQIAFWDAGAPAYGWIDLINARILAGTPTTTYPHRVYTYVALAMYDATIAAWESKYFYKRSRPSEVDRHLPTALPVPNSPSYPSEHAAASVLSYLLPAEAQTFQTMAEQAGWSRVLAGLQYPSDYHAGLALGRAVAEKVIEKARADGSDIVWTGTVPTGPCKWIGSNPGNVTAANWTPLLLSSPSQFRPAPPPACDSPEVLAETAVVRDFPRTFVTNYKRHILCFLSLLCVFCGESSSSAPVERSYSVLS